MRVENPAPAMSRSAAMTFIAGGLLAAAQPALAQTASATVRMGSLAIDASGESYYGVDSGIFAANGISAQIQTLTTGSVIITAVLAGDLDVGIANPLQIATGIARGIPLVMLTPAALYSLRDANANLVVAKNSPFKTPKDLVGATFGVSSLADFNQLSLLAYLDTNGVSKDSVHFIELPFSQVSAALERGTIQAAVITEPFKTDGVRAGQIRDFGDTYLTIAPEIAPIFWFTTKGWIQKNPDVAKRMVNAIYATAKWANAHTKESGETLARIAKMDPAIVANMKRLYFATSNDRKYTVNTLALATRYGMLPRPVTFEEFSAFSGA